MTWRKWTRPEMLEWFASLTDEKLRRAWIDARDKLDPKTSDDNFICRACRHDVPGIMCGIGKAHEDCEREVTANPAAWEDRKRDKVIEEGGKAFRLALDEGCKQCLAKNLDGGALCPYPVGSDKERRWRTGWKETKHFFEVEAEKG